MKFSPFISKALLAATAIAGLSVSAAAVELSLIRGQFQNTGADLDAAGTVHSTFTKNRPKLNVRLNGLTPGATYHFNVDGVSEADFTAAANGRAVLGFALTPSATQYPLDFDPRGRLLSVSDGTEDVLDLVFSGPGEPAEIAVDERTSLAPAEGVTRGKVEARYLEQKNQDRFIVHLLSMDRGLYTFFVDGQPEAEIDLSRGRSRMIVFSTNKNANAARSAKAHGNSKSNSGNSGRLALDFDPRGAMIDVVKDGAIVFSGEMLAQIRGINVVEAATSQTLLTSTGIDIDATATATLSVSNDGEREFAVEVGALPAGTYTLVIGGVERGTITVTDTAGVTSGVIKFSNEPEAGESLLDFDPRGQSVEIRQGATVFFTGTISSTLTPTPATSAADFELPLLNQGVIVGASGEASYESDGASSSNFAVEVGGVPAGAYDLLIDGVAKATITVTDQNGILAGSVTFASQPDSGELLLDFEPHGTTVAVAQSGTTILSRTLPQ